MDQMNLYRYKKDKAPTVEICRIEGGMRLDIEGYLIPLYTDICDNIFDSVPTNFHHASYNETVILPIKTDSTYKGYTSGISVVIKFVGKDTELSELSVRLYGKKIHSVTFQKVEQES